MIKYDTIHSTNTLRQKTNTLRDIFIKCFSGVTFKSRIVLIEIEQISYFPL